MLTQDHDLFSIKSIAHENGIILAVLNIDPSSEILKGHFPGHPVIPGASMLQTLKEVLEASLKTPVMLKKSDSLKFMRMIDPENTETVLLDIVYKWEENDIVTTAKLSTDKLICFKFQGTFTRV